MEIRPTFSDHTTLHNCSSQSRTTDGKTPGIVVGSQAGSPGGLKGAGREKRKRVARDWALGPMWSRNLLMLSS